MVIGSNDMLLKIFFRQLSVLTFILPCLQACAQQLQIYSENFPPFNHVVNGRPTGVAVDVFNALQSELGLNLPIQFAPWPRIYNYVLRRPNVAVFSMARNPSRENKVKWVGPIASYSTAFYASHQGDVRVSNIQ